MDKEKHDPETYIRVSIKRCFHLPRNIDGFWISNTDKVYTPTYRKSLEVIFIDFD